MLSGADVGKFAVATTRFHLDLAQLSQKLLTTRSERAGLFGRFEQLDGTSVGLGADMPAGTMATVVLDMEGGVAFGGSGKLRQRIGGIGIGVVVAS